MAEPFSLLAVTKKRLLEELLHSVPCKEGDWRILVVDDVTVKVFSSSCKISDVTEENVSLVEDLFKKREPMTHMHAIYFISPTSRSVKRLVADFEGEKQLYKRAHVFFSNQAPPSVLNYIKQSEAFCGAFRPPGRLTSDTPARHPEGVQHGVPPHRVAVLRHAHPERRAAAVFFDLFTFYTERAQDRDGYARSLDECVGRLASLFASLQEVPSIRFKGNTGGQASESAAFREQLSMKVAMQLADRITSLQRRQQNMPDVETCDLLIVDRSVDPVAPIVHDWSYECLIHDLLPLEGNVYKYRYVNNQDKEDERDVILDDQDKLFRELKAMHIGDVFNRITELKDEFLQKDKTAKARLKKGEKDLVDAKNIMRGIEMFQRKLREINVHDTLASEINKATRARGLTELGDLEQELIYGERANSKTIKKFLESKGGKGASRGQLLTAQLEAQDRLRMLLCYFGTHVEKLDGEAALKDWQARVGFSDSDARAILNLEQLGCAVLKRAGKTKAKRILRDVPPRKEDDYDLRKFYTRIQELSTQMAAGTLSQEAFPYVNPPTDGAQAQRSAARAARANPAVSARTVQRGRNREKAGEAAGGLGAPKGRRLVIFIVGPVAYNEIRAAHELSETLQREVIIGGTSIVNAEQFLISLKALEGPRFGSGGGDDDEEDSD